MIRFATPPMMSALRWRKPIVASLLFIYLAFHLLNGDRGLYSYFREQREHQLLEQELSALSDQRQALETRVSRLRNDSLDLDLLDEQARRMLGLMAEEEKMILLAPQQPLENK